MLCGGGADAVNVVLPEGDVPRSMLAEPEEFPGELPNRADKGCRDVIEGGDVPQGGVETVALRRTSCSSWICRKEAGFFCPPGGLAPAEPQAGEGEAAAAPVGGGARKAAKGIVNGPDSPPPPLGFEADPGPLGIRPPPPPPPPPEEDAVCSSRIFFSEGFDVAEVDAMAGDGCVQPHAHPFGLEDL